MLLRLAGSPRLSLGWSRYRACSAGSQANTQKPGYKNLALTKGLMQGLFPAVATQKKIFKKQYLCFLPKGGENYVNHHNKIERKNSSR
jgi:hypothetical protein